MFDVDEVTNWLSNLENEERFAFLKKVLTTFKVEELGGIGNCVVNEKKRRKRQEIPANRGVRQLEVSMPVSPMKPWWQNYSKDVFAAIDIEMVAVKLPLAPGQSKFRYYQTAADIAIVDFTVSKAMRYRVKHMPGTFLDSNYWENLTGYNANSFRNGEELHEVRRKVAAFFEDKVVIGCGVSSDFLSLDLNADDFKVFDIQKYWWRWTGTGNNERQSGHKLMHIVRYLFPEQKIFQSGAHSCVDGAKATMKCFKQYIATTTDITEEIPTGFIGGGITVPEE